MRKARVRARGLSSYASPILTVCFIFSQAGELSWWPIRRTA